MTKCVRATNCTCVTLQYIWVLLFFICFIVTGFCLWPRPMDGITFWFAASSNSAQVVSATIFHQLLIFFCGCVIGNTWRQRKCQVIPLFYNVSESRFDPNVQTNTFKRHWFWIYNCWCNMMCMYGSLCVCCLTACATQQNIQLLLRIMPVYCMPNS